MTVAYVGRQGAKLWDGSVRRRGVDWGDRGSGMGLAMRSGDRCRCVEGGRGQGKKLASTDTGRRETGLRGKAGSGRAVEEWTRQAVQKRGEALGGGDRTGKGGVISHGWIMSKYKYGERQVRGGPALVQISSGVSVRHNTPSLSLLLIISSSHGPTSAYHPPPTPTRPPNAFSFLLLLQPCLLHPYLLWFTHLMAPWLLR